MASGRLIINKGSAPSAPAAGKSGLFVDTADGGRIKAIDGDTGQTSVLTPANFEKNLIINGGFDFAQRQAPGTLTTYSSLTGRVYAADRWAITNAAASTQYQRISTVDTPETNMTARFYGRLKKITGAGKIALSQVVESVATMPLRGRKVRLQVRMRRTVAAAMTIRLGLVQNTAGGVTDGPSATFISAFGVGGTDPTMGTFLTRLTPVGGTADGGTIAGDAMSCVLGTGWVRYSCVFTVPTDCRNLIPMVWSDQDMAVNDELNVTEFGLYDGPDILDWVPMPYPLELERCCRFYQKTFQLDVAPAQNAGVQGAHRLPCTTAGAVATSIVGWWAFPVRMRLAPVTTVLYNPSAANAFARNITAGTDSTAAAAVDASERGLRYTCTGLAAWAVGADIALHMTIDSEI